MNTPSTREALLSRELEAAFRNRADLYRLLYEELSARMGADEAEAILSKVVKQRGEEVAAVAFASFGPNDARAVGEAFLAVSPDGGAMYPTEVERSDTQISFKVKRCPLKDAWTDTGMSDESLTTLCRIAGEFDRGLFEAVGLCFDNTTWSPGHGTNCCHITLKNRDCG